MKKWDRKLNTSKRDQGVKTPKQPRYLGCGCIKKWNLEKEKYDITTKGFTCGGNHN